jgi:hypothetical protein
LVGEPPASSNIFTCEKCSMIKLLYNVLTEDFH